MKFMVAAICIGALTCGCQTKAVAPKSPAPAPVPAAVASGSSGSPAEAYFPLQHGHNYRYRLIDTGGSLSKAIVRSERASKMRGALLVPGGKKTFRYSADGVLQEPVGAKPHYVLKAPFKVGSRWTGRRRSTIEIEVVRGAITVPAGSYSDCITTRETRGGDYPILIRTVFCRDVGMVSIEATAGGRQERMRLESYDAPIQLGPDGVKVLKD